MARSHRKRFESSMLELIRSSNKPQKNTFGGELFRGLVGFVSLVFFWLVVVVVGTVGFFLIFFGRFGDFWGICWEIAIEKEC